MRRLVLSLAALCALAAAHASAQTPNAGQPKGVPNLFPVLIDMKWGYVDRTGKLVVEAKYDRAGPFGEGLAVVGRGLITEGFDKLPVRGNTVLIPNDPAGWKWEIIDESGVVVSKLKFNPGFPSDFSEGLALFGGGASSLYGYMDKSGEAVIRPRFTMAWSFREGLAAACVGENKCGLIDRAGRYVVRPVYAEIGSLSDGLAYVKNAAGLLGYVDKSGETVIAPQFAGPCGAGFSEGLAPAAYPGTKCGFINKLGHFVVEPQFDYADAFSDGRALVRIGGKWGYADTEGRLAIQPQFVEAYGFSEGLALVRTCGREPAAPDAETYYEPCRYGFIDKTGKFAIEPRLDAPEHFRGGLALVHMTGGPGYIDREGNFVWKPSPPR